MAYVQLKVVRLIVSLVVSFVVLGNIYLQPPRIQKPKVKRSHPSRVHGVQNDTANLLDSYDYIVVGGGQSGLTVGNRLSQSGKATVLVIEYGYLYHDDPWIVNPWQPFDPGNNLYHDPKLMYNFSSTPQIGLNNRQHEVSASSSVGGGSTVNGMFLNRGAAEDYDAWEKLGNPGWGWKGILPYFKKSVTFTPPGKMLRDEFNVTYDNDAAYGEKGPIQLSFPEWAWPEQKNQMAGWSELGINHTIEGAGGDAVGTFWVPRAQDPVNQTRSYAVSGHLDPALTRSNFDLLPGYRVNNVMLSKDNRAEGVMIQTRGGHTTTVINANKEVIIAAGLHSPAILQRSGIGPSKVLKRANIDVRVELPGVGMNLQDHPAAGLAYSCKFQHSLSASQLTAITVQTDSPLNPGSINQVQAADEFKRTRAGVSFTQPPINLSTQSPSSNMISPISGPHAGGHNAALFAAAASFYEKEAILHETFAHTGPFKFLPFKYLPPDYHTEPALMAGYSAQLSLLSDAFDSNHSSIASTPIAGDSYSLLILQKPLSRGTITVDPTDPIDGDPLVNYNTFSHPLDVDVMIQFARFTRRWYNTTAMIQLGPVENSPGLEVQGYEELEGYFRNSAENSIGHQSGTTAMLPRELGGVVDSGLRVYGVEGLSVVDASVMPLIPSTNLCATVYAVAEKVC